MTPANLSTLVDRFDVFLLDQFGVLIGGNGAYPGAVEAVSYLLDVGKTVIVITNSGRRSGHTQERLERHGFPMANIRVVSSGEVARARLSAAIQQNGPMRVWYEAETRDASPLDGLAATYVDDVRLAQMMVIAGVRSEEVDLAAYRNTFEAAAGARIPCICTNPDMERLTANGRRIAPGRIAKTYEDMGGRVEWIGKPFRAIYDHALADVPEAARVICIGDSLAHDIAGAEAAGLQSALVQTGLAEGESDEALRQAAERLGAVPSYLIPALRLDT